MYHELDYEAQQRVLAYCKRRGPSFAEDDIVSALEDIYDAMQHAQIMVDDMTKQHNDALKNHFLQAGIAHPDTSDVPYLETETANLAYFFIKKMEALFVRVEAFLNSGNKNHIALYHGNSSSMKALDAAMEWKQFDNDPALVEQVRERILKDIERAQVQINQRLDEQQQRMVGFTHYIWRTRDDDKVRSLHATYDNAVFSWDNPPEGGHPGHAYGCRCVAEPLLESLTRDIPRTESTSSGAIEPAYPEFYLLGGAAVTRAGAIMNNVKTKLDDIILFRRPNGVPRDWVRTPSRNNGGIRYRDPKNIHNEVRIQKGNPKSKFPNSQTPYIRWKKDGHSLDKNGTNVPRKSSESHIPFEEFKFNAELFK